MIAFYNPGLSYYAHHYYNHPYIYTLPYSPYLYYDSHPAIHYQTAVPPGVPSDISDLLNVFAANNLGNLATLRYPPYSSWRFRYYQDL